MGAGSFDHFGDEIGVEEGVGGEGWGRECGAEGIWRCKLFIFCELRCEDLIGIWI